MDSLLDHQPSQTTVLNCEMSQGLGSSDYNRVSNDNYKNEQLNTTMNIHEYGPGIWTSQVLIKVL